MQTVKNIINPESEKIKEELRKVEGFVDVNEKLDEIKKRLSNTLSDDPVYEDFANKLAQLVNSHPFFSSNNKGKEQS